MGLYRYAPPPSGRMGLLWTLGGIRDAAILEFGSMGHMIYAERWLWQSGIDTGGKLFTTHLDEKDIALGITKRFSEAVREIIEQRNPRVIFVLPSTIPEIIGTDMEVLCQEAEDECAIPVIALKKGNFKEKLHNGIEEALYCAVRELACKHPGAARSEKVTYNLIGSCMDLAKFEADALELKRLLKEALGMEPICVLSSEASVSQIEEMGSAHINLVLRREGLKAAEELKSRFGTEYVYGLPYGYQGTAAWLRGIAEQTGLTLNEEFIRRECAEGHAALQYCRQIAAVYSSRAKISLGGNYDVVKGILEFAVNEAGLKPNYIWSNAREYADAFIPYQEEHDLIQNITREFEGILMADKPAYPMAGRKSGALINRSLDSRLFNKYESPYMGFRGAMNLCALWLEELLPSL